MRRGGKGAPGGGDRGAGEKGVFLLGVCVCVGGGGGQQLLDGRRGVWLRRRCGGLGCHERAVDRLQRLEWRELTRRRVRCGVHIIPRCGGLVDVHRGCGPCGVEEQK